MKHDNILNHLRSDPDSLILIASTVHSADRGAAHDEVSCCEAFEPVLEFVVHLLSTRPIIFLARTKMRQN